MCAERSKPGASGGAQADSEAPAEAGQGAPGRHVTESVVQANPVLVEAVRGPLTESRHRAAVSVVDADGSVLFERGDVERIVLPRSSLKPFQSIELVESGALDAFGLTDRHLALACGSHNGEFAHVRRVRNWLESMGCDESHLMCAADRPLGEKWLLRMPSQCAPPSRFANNCSGKHAAFLTISMHRQWPAPGYTDPEHPLQRRIASTLSALSGVPVDEMPIASDNCGAPVFGLPLRALALASARLSPQAAVDGVSSRSRQRVIDAMRAHPRMVAGYGRADTILMQYRAFGGISKVGAEGVFMACIPEQGIGLAVKVDDGADRAAHVLGVAVLGEIGILNPESVAVLHDRIMPRFTGPDGAEIGRIRVLPL